MNDLELRMAEMSLQRKTLRTNHSGDEDRWKMIQNDDEDRAVLQKARQ